MPWCAATCRLRAVELHPRDVAAQVFASSNARRRGAIAKIIFVFHKNCTCKKFGNQYDRKELTLSIVRERSTKRMDSYFVSVGVARCPTQVGPSPEGERTTAQTLLGGRKVAKKKVAKKPAKKVAKKAAPKKKVAKKAKKKTAKK